MKIELNKLKIAVIGDVMLDEYVFGKSDRISPENPIPVVNYNSKDFRAGGAANVAVNLSNLGINTDLYSLMSDDEGNAKILKIIKKHKIKNLSIKSKKISTTVKLRIYSNDYQIARLDKEQIYSGNLSDYVVSKLIKNIDKYDAIIVSDYGKGVINKSLTKLISKASKKKVIVGIDPYTKSKKIYKNSTFITPNLKEFEILVGKKVNSNNIKKLSLSLKKELNLKYLLITAGSKGIHYIDSDNTYNHSEAYAKSVYDVIGAGDTVLSIITAFLGLKSNISEAVRYSLIGGSVVVQKKGTSYVSKDELFISDSNEKKIFFLEKFLLERKLFNEKKIIFTNGCFDIFHAGHMDYLIQASKLGDIFVIAINDDHSVKLNKGKNRPINTLDKRSSILCNLSFVDYVIPFSEKTPLNLIKKIKPNIIVKGGDYTNKKNIVGYNIVRKYGGDVLLIKKKYNISSTQILNKKK